MQPQTISASYIADLIEMNEQAEQSIAVQLEKAYSLPYNQSEIVATEDIDAWIRNGLDSLRRYHAFLVARENAEHQAERLTKSTIGL